MKHLRDIITEPSQKNRTDLDWSESHAEDLRRHQEALREEVSKTKRWRDGYGVVHELRPCVRYNVSTSSTVVWSPACGRRYQSRITCWPTEPVTCLSCLAAGPLMHHCHVCGHRQTVHDDRQCFDCVRGSAVSPMHTFDPDYRYPYYEPEE